MVFFREAKKFTLPFFCWALLFIGLFSHFSHTDAAKPFWTEKTSFEEGDKTYFVGVTTNIAKIEDARTKAFLAAKEELVNHFQIFETKGLTIHSQMNYEEKNKDNTFTVYRLIWVVQDEIIKLKEKNAKTEEEVSRKNIKSLDKIIKQKKDLVTKIQEKEAEIEKQDSLLEKIKERIINNTEEIKKVRCGMTPREVVAVFGKPDKIGDHQNMLYGTYWVIFVDGVVACLYSIEEFSKSHGTYCGTIDAQYVGFRNCQ